VADFVKAILRSPHPAEELAQLAAAAQRMPLEACIALLSYPYPREHWRDIARAVRVPLLYAITRQYAEQADNLARHRPGTQVEIFESAGHALFADEPARFNALLAAFVADNGLI
jgi:microsomal epoxide hydrolase